MERNGRLAERVSAGLSRREGRQFAFTLAPAFLVVAIVLWWRGYTTIVWPVVGVSSVFALAGLLVPARLGPLRRAWMAMARGISRITTPVLMSIVFFGVITPIGLLMRMVGRNPIKRSGTEDSYWVPRARDRQRRGTMTNQF